MVQITLIRFTAILPWCERHGKAHPSLQDPCPPCAQKRLLPKPHGRGPKLPTDEPEYRSDLSENVIQGSPDKYVEGYSLLHGAGAIRRDY